MQYTVEGLGILEATAVPILILVKRPNEKLRPRYYEPDEILGRIGDIAYRLALPISARIHPIFHVSELKKVILPKVHSQPLPPCLTDDLELLLQQEEVKEVQHFPDGKLEVLIKWDLHQLKVPGNTMTLLENSLNFPLRTRWYSLRRYC